MSKAQGQWGPGMVEYEESRSFVGRFCSPQTEKNDAGLWAAVAEFTLLSGYIVHLSCTLQGQGFIIRQ